MVTGIRLFASVDPQMHGQGTALDETFVTILDGALIWSFIGVDAKMAAEI